MNEETMGHDEALQLLKEHAENITAMAADKKLMEGNWAYSQSYALKLKEAVEVVKKEVAEIKDLSEYRLEKSNRIKGEVAGLKSVITRFKNKMEDLEESIALAEKGLKEKHFHGAKHDIDRIIGIMHGYREGGIV